MHESPDMTTGDRVYRKSEMDQAFGGPTNLWVRAWVWRRFRNDHCAAGAQERRCALQCQEGLPECAGCHHVEIPTHRRLQCKTPYVRSTKHHPITQVQFRARMTEEIHPALTPIRQRDSDVRESNRDHQTRQSTPRTEIKQFLTTSRNCGHK